MRQLAENRFHQDRYHTLAPLKCWEIPDITCGTAMKK